MNIKEQISRSAHPTTNYRVPIIRTSTYNRNFRVRIPYFCDEFFVY